MRILEWLLLRAVPVEQQTQHARGTAQLAGDSPAARAFSSRASWPANSR